MAIEDILLTLESQAQADIDSVLTEAREHASMISEEAEREAEGIRGGFKETAERNAGNQAAKMVNAARLEAKMTVSSVRGQGIDEVFRTAAERMSAQREAPGYDALFSRLAAEAVAGLEGQLVLHVDGADVARAQAFIATAGLTASVEGDVTSAGGLIVEANGGRVFRRNTLENRVERVRQFVQADVARVLFA